MRALTALIALAACGGDAVHVPIELGFDDSCDNAPEQTPCEANVGLYLLGGEGGVLESICLDFGTGARPIDELPEVLSDRAEFTGVTASSIRVELAMYSPPQPGCPRFDGEGVPPILFGRSEAVDPATADRIHLSMSCTVSSPGLATCETACDDADDRCAEQLPGDGDLAGCSEALDVCLGMCSDSDCNSTCLDQHQQCVHEVEACDQAYDRCLDDCDEQARC